MQYLSTGLILGSNRYRVDNAKGGKIYMIEPAAETESEDAVGLGLRKFEMPYELFDQLSGKRLPGVFDVLAESVAAGQDNDKEQVVSVRGDGTLNAETLTELFQPIAKAAGKVPDQPMEGAAFALAFRATRYAMDNGVKGAYLYIAQKTSGRNPNQIGFEVVRFAMPYELFEAVKEKGLPGEYKLQISLRSGAGNKARLRIDAITGDNHLDKARLLELFGLTAAVLPPQGTRPVIGPEVSAKAA